MCTKCGDKVVGEGTGCTAMEKVFHVSCFTCHACHAMLQGRPFFAVENKPHCEECYMVRCIYNGLFVHWNLVVCMLTWGIYG